MWSTGIGRCSFSAYVTEGCTRYFLEDSFWKSEMDQIAVLDERPERDTRPALIGFKGPTIDIWVVDQPAAFAFDIWDLGFCPAGRICIRHLGSRRNS